MSKSLLSPQVQEQTKMKRAIKILTLILIVVFVFGVFASCDVLIGKDVAKYRSQVAMTVGSQEITIGKLLDTFNSYYNNYAYYISYGLMTMDDLVEMVVSSLTQQYMQIDDYVTKHANDDLNTDLKGKATYAEYLESWEFEYCIKYVRHIAFKTFDASVESQVAAKYDLKDAEAEDTSRDFTEDDDLFDAESYAQYLYKKNFDATEINEYFDKYYGEDVKFDAVDIDSYIYNDEDVSAARLKEFNDRMEDDSEELKFDELVEIQKKVLKQYEDTVKSNYGITLNAFLQGQLNDMVSSSLLAKWSYEAYEGLDGDEELQKILSDRFDIAKNAQLTDFNQNDNFDSFITSLSSGSYLYNVPTEEAKNYVFVKNILVPFTTAQTNRLKVLADRLGDTENETYIAARNAEAVNILAQYFDSDKYDDSFEALFDGFLKEDEDEDAKTKYEKLSGLFTTGKDDEGNDKIEIKGDGALGKFFDNGKVVVPEGLDREKTTAEDVFVELMKRFNTDVGQHSATYDYVVYVGSDWEDYDHAWVEEFYTAVNKVVGANPDDVAGRYAMCVSTYGVHIIYIDGYVGDYEFDSFSFGNVIDSSTTDYRWFKEQGTFDDKVSELTKDKLEELEQKYLSDDLIKVNSEFDKFLKENSITFDFSGYLAERKEEYDI